MLVIMKRTASDITGLPQLEEVKKHNRTHHRGMRTLAGKRQSTQPSLFGRTGITIEQHTEIRGDDAPYTGRGTPNAKVKNSQFPDIEGTADGHGSEGIMSSTVDKPDLEWVLGEGRQDRPYSLLLIPTGNAL